MLQSLASRFSNSDLMLCWKVGNDCELGALAIKIHSFDRFEKDLKDTFQKDLKGIFEKDLKSVLSFCSSCRKEGTGGGDVEGGLKL